jgi:acyl-CoA thioesterase-1
MKPIQKQKPSAALVACVFLGMSLAMAACGDDSVETEQPGADGSSGDSNSYVPGDDDVSPEQSFEDSEDSAGSQVGDQAADDAAGSAPDADSPVTDADSSVTDADSSVTDADSSVTDAGPGAPADDTKESSPEGQPNAGAEGGDPAPSEILDGGGETPSLPLRIVPIGDSITQGRLGDGSFDSSEASTLSYRYALWQLFVDAGIDVDFVGSHTGGFGGDPAWEDYRGQRFDRDHEGHWGWRLDDIRDSLPAWLGEYEADVALIMLGTNDVNAGDTVSQMLLEAEEIIAILRQANPDIVIIWGHAFQDWDPFPAFREEMEALAIEMSTARSPILTVSRADDWVSDPSLPSSDTVDWVHPNLRGDQKLAEAFFEAIVALFPIE